MVKQARSATVALDPLPGPGFRFRELARRLRHERGDLPVLLMTPHPDEATDAERAPSEGEIRLVSKPFTAEGLVSAVRRALEG